MKYKSFFVTGCKNITVHLLTFLLEFKRFIAPIEKNFALTPLTSVGDHADVSFTVASRYKRLTARQKVERLRQLQRLAFYFVLAAVAYGVAMAIGAGIAFGFFGVCGILFEGMFWFSLLRRNDSRIVKRPSP